MKKLQMELDDIFEELLVLVTDYGAQVDVPIESEQFFTTLIEEFHGTQAEFLSFVRDNLPLWFRSVPEHGPSWIQEAEWQFHDGKPMLFLGEIPIPKSAGLFHDDAAVFVFLSEDGVSKSVIQVA